jgi:hypothetical protein
MDDNRKTSMRRTTHALNKIQGFRGQSIYLTLIELLEETQMDIRFANDSEPDKDQMLRNQGGIHWIGELVREMKRDPKQDRKPTDTDVDGAYTV